MGRPVKKVHKSQQQRKKEDRLTYIMLGVVAVVFVVIAAVLVF